MYTETELAGIAKRENNKKRSYLVVNPLQGKHIPVYPQKAFQMFKELAEMIKVHYSSEKLLLIGFAETATAIGAALAVELNSYYIQTTRENIDNVNYLYFSESHSHATEQKLVKEDIDSIIKKIDRVIFAEDEVTTGNTILNIIRLMEETYSQPIRFAVASLLNGMNPEAQRQYQNKKIPTHYLVKTNHDTYEGIAEKYKGDGDYYPLNFQWDISYHTIMTYEVNGYQNARRLLRGRDYAEACEQLWQWVKAISKWNEKNRILVLGTEEFMYPPLYVAAKLEEMGNMVKCHSTTRSPIAVSREENYPLHKRFELRSLYDEERTTYLYDLETYDRVIILTDANCAESKGIYSLLHALVASDNHVIDIVCWK